jgi:hypothetical protein
MRLELMLGIPMEQVNQISKECDAQFFSMHSKSYNPYENPTIRRSPRLFIDSPAKLFFNIDQ